MTASTMTSGCTPSILSLQALVLMVDIAYQVQQSDGVAFEFRRETGELLKAAKAELEALDQPAEIKVLRGERKVLRSILTDALHYLNAARLDCDFGHAPTSPSCRSISEVCTDARNALLKIEHDLIEEGRTCR